MAIERKLKGLGAFSDDPRISPKSLEHQALDVIRSSILSGRYAAGGRLTETRVAEDLGLSRGTIRGALQELTHEGLVVLSPYRGWSVVSLSSADAWEIYTLRNALEGLATGIVAESITEETSSQIEKNLDLMRAAVKTGRRDKIIRSDFELHRKIIELSGHGRLLQQYKIIETQTLMFVSMAGAFLDVKDYVSMHEELIKAVVSGDSATARKLATDHNTLDGRELVKRLEKMEARSSRIVPNL